MDIIQTVVLAIIEGLTEFLPISSTGHLILASDFLNIRQTDFLKSFEIYIQLGAILSVLFLYLGRLKKKEVILPTLTAFLPTAAIGFLLYGTVKNFLLGNTLITLAALFWGGVFIILIEYFYKEREHHVESIEKISLKNSFIIGLFQSVSLVPGVSRAAATIIGARLMGVRRKTAAEFSFILALPTMLSATTLDLIKSDFSFTTNETLLIILGFVSSFVVATLAIKFFVDYIQNHSFIIFGIYRIILSILFYFFILK
ncbi:MAG: Undecaprenyl-diphosphatase [Candidatus Levybacteria bacterium GW2011_GWA2_40_8]|nr:MAG: Undecaprenyl-diphosphatase [Candidatus Levybacteria bacterium GW2011_GWA2_40_8]